MGSDLMLLEDYLELVTYGFTNPMPNADFGPWKITAKDVINGEINFNTARKTTQEAFDTKLTPKSRPRVGDVLLTKDGTLGRLAIVREEGLCINQSVAVLRPNSKITSEYLYYLLSTSKYQMQMINNADGSVIKHIYITRVGKMEVNIPSVDEQESRLKHLAALDQKITLNQQINQTLELMAQTLFKSWFIDFDPVIDNALAAGNDIPEALAPKAEKRKAALAQGTKQSLSKDLKKLFPNKFIFNDRLVKWVPDGWEANHIGEFVELSQGLAINAKSKYLLVEQGLPLLRITDLINGSEIHFIDEKKVSQKCIASSSDIIFTRTGQVGLVFTNKKGVVHNNCFKILSKGDLLNKYIYWFLRRSEIYEYTNSVASGSVQQDLNHSAFKTIPIVCPSMEIQIKSEEYWENLNRKLVENKKQIESLAQLRDTLLPKLISGELQISDLKVADENTV